MRWRHIITACVLILTVECFVFKRPAICQCPQRARQKVVETSCTVWTRRCVSQSRCWEAHRLQPSEMPTRTAWRSRTESASQGSLRTCLHTVQTCADLSSHSQYTLQRMTIHHQLYWCQDLPVVFIMLHYGHRSVKCPCSDFSLRNWNYNRTTVQKFVHYHHYYLLLLLFVIIIVICYYYIIF